MLTRFTIKGAVAIAIAMLAGCAADDADPIDAAAPASPATAVAPAASAVITDAAGNQRYLVMLDASAAAGMPRAAITDHRFAAYHPAPLGHLVRAIERDHGITAIAMTSQVSAALIAYLTPAQAEALRRDPRVRELVADHVVAASADALSVWLDHPNAPSELESWGTQAVNPGGGGAGATLSKKPPFPAPLPTRVYVLDSGVEDHGDLNVVQRVNAFRPTDPIANARPGCYPHGTHVAGIVGARADGAGSRGVAAGVQLVSVSLLYPGTGNDTGCIGGGPSDAGVTLGLDWIAADTAARGRPGVVNISSNGYAASTYAALRTAATPTKRYPGVFVAQSAGNNSVDACGRAFPDASPGDGVMVVGMLNDHGQSVRPLSGVNGSRNGALAGSEPGSNFGPCVEVWAPGRSIYSTWAGGSHAYLSGTSMAAPHIAGLAAIVAGTATTSTEIEAAVRAHMVAVGSSDQSGAPIAMATLAPRSPIGAFDTPYAEVIASGYLLPTSDPEQPLTAYTDEPFTLAFDSVGSRGYACNLTRRLGGGASQPLFTGVRTRLDNQVWTPGVWSVSSTNCPSAHTLVTSVAPPAARWLLDGAVVSGQAIALRADTTAALAYDSTNAMSCDLSVGLKDPWVYAFPPIAGYPLANHGTSDPHVTLARTPGFYQYLVTCRDAYGAERSASVLVTMTEAPVPQINDAAFVSQSVPATVEAGASFTASLTLRNTGTTTWTAATWYRLGAQNPHDNTSWGTGRVDLDPWDAIAPNQTKTFTYTFHAPTTPGTYGFQWRMVRETIAWFGAWSDNRDLVVTAPPPVCGANPACQPGQTRISACGNCGSRVDTCGTTCQWSLGACAGEGVCAPGDSDECCPCSAIGCSCSGVTTCTNACTWGACAGYACGGNDCP